MEMVNVVVDDVHKHLAFDYLVTVITVVVQIV
jgi:hypothetical protein